MGKAQKNFGPAANNPSVKMAYTAAIGDTSANARDSADLKLNPRRSCSGEPGAATVSSSIGCAICCSCHLSLKRHSEGDIHKTEVGIDLNPACGFIRSSRFRGLGTDLTAEKRYASPTTRDFRRRGDRRQPGNRVLPADEHRPAQGGFAMRTTKANTNGVPSVRSGGHTTSAIGSESRGPRFGQAGGVGPDLRPGRALVVVGRW